MREEKSTVDYIISFLCAAVMVVGGIGLYDTFRPLGLTSASTSQVGPVLDPIPIPDPWVGRTRVTILLVGADERPERDDPGRSDTLLTVFINPRRKQAAVLSIPRDLRTHIPGFGTEKINAAYSLGAREDSIGGPALCRETVEELLGIPIEHYVAVNFGGFQHIVDLLGGVDLEVEKRMLYHDEWGNLHIDLQPGFQHLDGYEAMCYVRYRNDSDYERMKRQRKFLKTMAQQALRARNIVNLVRVIPQVSEALTTTMSYSELAAAARLLNEMDPATIMGAQLPVVEVSRHPYYSAFDEGGYRRLSAQIEEHLDSDPAAPCLVEVLNGGGTEGAATDAAERLAAKGFQIAAVGNADSFSLRSTVIRYQQGQIHTAQWVARILEAGEPRAEDDPLTYYERNAPIRVILGRDYEPAQPPEITPATASGGDSAGSG